MSERAERLDRLLSRLGYGSRRDAACWIRQGLVEVAGDKARSASQKVLASEVLLEGKPLDHPHGLHVIYHKPVGQVCSRKEEGELVYAAFPERWLHRKPPFSPVGRLDKETSGLLLLTDDGQLNHRLTSPKHHISKTYAVTLARPLRADAAEILAGGKLLLEGDDRPCLPAQLYCEDERHVSIVLHEGRYHQVRRMFAALGNHVEALTRTHIGYLALADTGLAAGAWQSVSSDVLWAMVTERKGSEFWTGRIYDND